MSKKETNTGHYNTGDYNTGYYNTGDYNIGHYNTGDYNTGYYNTGSYNTIDRSTGYFNTKEPTVVMFNKDTGLLRKDIEMPLIEIKLTERIDEARMTPEQKAENPDFRITKGILITRTYKEAWALAWDKLDDKTKQKFLDLPNFDANIFLEITGIDVRQKPSCSGKVVEIDGVKYKLTEV